MHRHLHKVLKVTVVWACSQSLSASEIAIRGNVTAELLGFTASSVHSAEHSQNASLAAEIELYREFGDSRRSVVFTPFARVDQRDDERSHVDIRELMFTQSADTWELRIGIGQEFWGVAESRNPVDIINQFDTVESLFTDAKLGQPMINATLVRDWGTLGLYILPLFRERTFAGVDGRPRLPTVLDIDNPQYEDDAEDAHVDFALRYTTVLDEWDIGLSYFTGTSRDPLFAFDTTSQSLRPLYYQVDQLGLDVQATLESWLLKTELIHRSGDLIEDHLESVIGFEYSFYGVNDSNVDIGVVVEHLWDERDKNPQALQNDLLLGLRFALNDEDSSEALIGIITDLDGQGQTLSLEASRRIGSSLRFSTEAIVWFGTDDDDTANVLRNEDYVKLELSYFF